jgi:hypothetical protein
MLRVTSLLKGKMSVVLTMTSLGIFFAPSISIGMILSTLHFVEQDCPNVLFSIRTKLRNADPEYDFASSFFLRCLYEDESGDPDSPDVGFLKGPLLLRVSTFALVYSFQS